MSGKLSTGIYFCNSDCVHYRVSVHLYLNGVYVYYIESINAVTKPNYVQHLICSKEFKRMLDHDLYIKEEHHPFEELNPKHFEIAIPSNITKFYRDPAFKEVKKKKGKPLKVTKTKTSKPKKVK